MRFVPLLHDDNSTLRENKIPCHSERSDESLHSQSRCTVEPSLGVPPEITGVWAIALPRVVALAAGVGGKLRSAVALAPFLFALSALHAQAPTTKADIIFTHANAYTGVP